MTNIFKNETDIKLYTLLPRIFSTSEFIDLAKEWGYCKWTVTKRKIPRWMKLGLIIRLRRGIYHKKY